MEEKILSLHCISFQNDKGIVSSWSVYTLLVILERSDRISLKKAPCSLHGAVFYNSFRMASTKGKISGSKGKP